MTVRRNNKQSYQAGKSLRRKTSETSSENLGSVSVFLACCLHARLGVYMKLSETTGSLRLKIYDQDETYEETLMKGEDWSELFVDFAEDLGFGEIYEARAAQARREAAGSRFEGRRGGNPSQASGKGPTGSPENAEGPS